MLPCADCAYREAVPGSAHIACARRWTVDPAPRGRAHGVRNGWYTFPVEFDPTWGPERCVGHSPTRQADEVSTPAERGLLALIILNEIRDARPVGKRRLK